MPLRKQETTQRAYTLKLRGPDGHDRSWKQNLWKTHVAVNAGVKIFGDWLLTLRGGLIPEDNLKPEQKRILALSWFCVESPELETGKTTPKNLEESAPVAIASAVMGLPRKTAHRLT